MYGQVWCVYIWFRPALQIVQMSVSHSLSSCIHMSMNTYEHEYIWACIRMSMNTYEHEYVWACIRMSMNIYEHEYIWAWIHMSTYTYEHVYIWAWACVSFAIVLYTYEQLALLLCSWRWGACQSTFLAIIIYRVGMNCTYTVHLRYFWQGNHQIYGHIRCTYTIQANPMYTFGSLYRLCMKHSLYCSAAGDEGHAVRLQGSRERGSVELRPSPA